MWWNNNCGTYTQKKSWKRLIQLALFWQGMLLQELTSDSQRWPVQPGSHSQWNWATPSRHTPPFMHGDDTQSSTFTCRSTQHIISWQLVLVNNFMNVIKPKNTKVVENVGLLSHRIKNTVLIDILNWANMFKPLFLGT